MLSSEESYTARRLFIRPGTEAAQVKQTLLKRAWVPPAWGRNRKPWERRSQTDVPRRCPKQKRRVCSFPLACVWTRMSLKLSDNTSLQSYRKLVLVAYSWRSFKLNWVFSWYEPDPPTPEYRAQAGVWSLEQPVAQRLS